MAMKAFTEMYVEVAPPANWEGKLWRRRADPIRLVQREWVGWVCEQDGMVMAAKSFPFWVAEHSNIIGLGQISRTAGKTVGNVCRFFQRIEGSIENASEPNAARG